VDDSSTWTRPWTYMIRLKKTDGQVYEYACHEANHALENMLRMGDTPNQRER
jgi:hypothetical protein